MVEGQDSFGEMVEGQDSRDGLGLVLKLGTN